MSIWLFSEKVVWECHPYLYLNEMYNEFIKAEMVFFQKASPLHAFTAP